MTRQFRLILWFFFGFALSAVSLFSFAADPHFLDGDNPYQACEAASPPQTGSWVGSCQDRVDSCPPDQDGGSCMIDIRRSYTQYGFTNDIQFLGRLYYCPDATPNWNGRECVKTEDKCKPLKGINVTSGYVGPEATRLTLNLKANAGQDYLGHLICSENCKAVITKEVGSSGMAFSGRYYGVFEAKFDGSSCPIDEPDISPTSDPDKVVAKDSEEKKCVDQGKGFGYVNGVVMCVTPDTKKGTADKKTETQNQDGTKTTVETNVTMSCTGEGSCVTTTTTTTTVSNPDGTEQSKKTDVKTETKTGNGPDTGGGEGSPFCIENPSSPLCKSGSFSGSCDSGFTCEGDPAACASAKALQEQKCEQSKAAESLAAHADENLIQFDQAKADAALNKDGAKDMKLNEIWESKKQTYLNFAKGCPVSERTFTLMGTTYTFDLSIVCTIGEFVSVLMHLAAYMFALRLFQRTVF